MGNCQSPKTDGALPSPRNAFVPTSVSHPHPQSPTKPSGIRRHRSEPSPIIGGVDDFETVRPAKGRSRSIILTGSGLFAWSVGRVGSRIFKPLDNFGGRGSDNDGGGEGEGGSRRNLDSPPRLDRDGNELPSGDGGNSSETNHCLMEMKASNYDHVHEIVNLGLAGIQEERKDSERSNGGGGGLVVGVVLPFMGGNKKRGSTALGSGLVGLTNMGNTCFMNSSLQCLSNTIPLTDYFLGYDYRSEINHENFLGTKGALVSSYAEVMKHLWLGSDASHKPHEFKSKLERFAPQFEGYDQQDAQELMALLLDGIHEDLNRVKQRPYIEDKDCDGLNDEGDAITSWANYLQRNRSIIVDLFQGQLRNTMTCRNRNSETNGGNECGCGHKNVRFDPFMYLSLPIGEDCQTLDDCLALFCEEELLTGDEMWYCPRCKEHVEATKKIDLWMLPPILIIHLKRFKFSAGGGRSKIVQPVKYPFQNWDLQRMKKSRGGSFPMYDLYAVSHHRGDVGYGHYTAHGINRFDNRWYDFNDSMCQPIDPEKEGIGVGASAYCLFYHRVERTRDESTGAMLKRSTPVIRRQSTNRPELWPHLQRAKARDWTSVRILSIPDEESIELESPLSEDTQKSEGTDKKKMQLDAAESKEEKIDNVQKGEEEKKIHVEAPLERKEGEIKKEEVLAIGNEERKPFS